MQGQMRAPTNSKGQILLNANVIAVMVIEVCWSVIVESAVVIVKIAALHFKTKEKYEKHFKNDFTPEI